MVMLSEVRRFLNEKRADAGLVGVKPEFEAEFERRAREVRAAIVAENGLSSSWLYIPDDTVLGDRSLELFNELVEWVRLNEGAAINDIIGLS